MQSEVVTRRADVLTRRLILEPGEATPWHTDSSIGGAENAAYFAYPQPNIWWGLSGCIVALVPLLGRQAVLKPGRERWHRVAAGGGLAMALLHVLEGLSIAAVVPTLNLRQHELRLAETLSAARARTAPEARFSIDPSLHDLDLTVYLSRPALTSIAGKSEVDNQDLRHWFSLCLRGMPPPANFLARFDAIVLDARRAHVRAFLASQGWEGATLHAEFEIWQPAP